MNSNKKGKDLEHAVYLLESLIINTNPSLKSANFRIEKNKIVIVNGVKHEIDIHVEIDLGDSYNSSYIFECKNWDYKNVGKSEIIEFSEKIKATNSQYGFFLAKGFGKYAEAQAKLDSRIKLKTVKSDFFDLRTLPIPGHLQNRRSDEDEFELTYQFENSIDEIKVTDISSFLKKEFIVKGKKAEPKKLIKQLLNRMFDEKFKSIRTDLWSSGSYSDNYSLWFNFNPNVLIIDNKGVSRLKIDAVFKTDIVKPIIKSKFKIQGRGRIVTVGYSIPKNEEFVLEIIERNKL